MPTMVERVYRILHGFYGNSYDNLVLEVMAEFIVEAMNHNGFRTRRDVEKYLASHVANSDRALAASYSIYLEFPSMLKDD